MKSCGMVTLCSVTESNLNDVLRLSVTNAQKRFVPSPAGILARAWAHRGENAVVHVICLDERPVGLVLLYDLTEEPACHCLMEMMVDQAYQNRGAAQRALRLILETLANAPRFPLVELAVDRENMAAIHTYEKSGFVDSGYVDPDLPQYRHFVYRFG